jgi:hypothetical protein
MPKPDSARLTALAGLVPDVEQHLTDPRGGVNARSLDCLPLLPRAGLPAENWRFR